MDRNPSESADAIAFLLPWSLGSAGGVNQVVINLYRQCRTMGPWKPVVIEGDWRAVEPIEGRFEDVRTLKFRIRPVVDHSRGLRTFLVYCMTFPLTVLRLLRFVRDQRIRVVNAHYPTTALCGFLLLRKLRLFTGRVIISLHGQDIRGAKQGRRFEWAVWRWMLRNADYVVPCSVALSRELESAGDKASSNVHVIRNGIDIASIESTIEHAQPSEAMRAGPREYLVNVATFEQKKGQDILLDAFYRISNEYPDLSLVLIGRTGPMLPSIRARIQELGLDRRVRIIADASHGEALVWLKNSVALVLPSRSEGLPLVILEAGALKVPIVATRVDGIPEVIDSPDLGVLVGSEDSEELVDGIRQILRSDVYRLSAAQALRARIASEFTWRHAWSEYVRLVTGDVS